jgi:hypothetical protein
VDANLAFIQSAEVPEPGTVTMTLGALGLLAFLVKRYRRMTSTEQSA